MSVRNRVRLALVGAVVLGGLALAAADWQSSRAGGERRGLRLVTANANAQPREVALALRALSPDVVALQETGGSCREAAGSLGLGFLDGSDQCLLSAWPMTPAEVAWPGPWQPPQVVAVAAPQPLVVANVRLAIPEAVAALATLGSQWYSEEERQAQFPALEALLGPHASRPTIACGDFNAFPSEVDLGERFSDAWRRGAPGASFPAFLPAVRIDQCWTSPEAEVLRAWTTAIPSDHRALVVELALAEPQGPSEPEPTE